jgi:RimJ/RimL family protein N-acetyltransferase
MSDIVFREGEKAALRPLLRADVPQLLRWFNDPEVTQFLLRSLPITEKEEEEWVDTVHKRTDGVFLGIVDRKNNKLIGSMGLHNLNWQHRTATTGTTIGDKSYWGKGYGTEAKMLLLDLAFNRFDLYAILSRIFAFNGRSIAYGKKCGYEEVGRIPNWIRGPDGKRHDEVLLQVTQERWRPLWEAYLATRGSTKK